MFRKLPLFNENFRRWAVISAAKGGHLDLVKMLLQENSIHISDRGEAVYYAAKGGHLMIVQFLLDGHTVAKFHIGDAFKGAGENGRQDVIEYLLKNHSSQVTSRDKDIVFRKTLHMHKNPSVIKLLLKDGNIKQWDIERAFQESAGCVDNNSEMLRVFIENENLFSILNPRRTRVILDALIKAIESYRIENISFLREQLLEIPVEEYPELLAVITNSCEDSTRVIEILNRLNLDFSKGCFKQRLGIRMQLLLCSVKHPCLMRYLPTGIRLTINISSNIMTNYAFPALDFTRASLNRVSENFSQMSWESRIVCLTAISVAGMDLYRWMYPSLEQANEEP